MLIQVKKEREQESAVSTFVEMKYFIVLISIFGANLCRAKTIFEKVKNLSNFDFECDFGQFCVGNDDDVTNSEKIFDFVDCANQESRSDYKFKVTDFSIKNGPFTASFSLF